MFGLMMGGCGNSVYEIHGHHGHCIILSSAASDRKMKEIGLISILIWVLSIGVTNLSAKVADKVARVENKIHTLLASSDNEQLNNREILSMQGNIVPAEVIPLQSKTNVAALELQRLGFRILHIGATISIEGTEALWYSTFNVSFVTQTKQIYPGIEAGDVSYRQAVIDNLRIPSRLKQFISDVAFVEPPELF